MNCFDIFFSANFLYKIPVKHRLLGGLKIILWTNLINCSKTPLVPGIRALHTEKSSINVRECLGAATARGPNTLPSPRVWPTMVKIFTINSIPNNWSAEMTRFFNRQLRSVTSLNLLITEAEKWTETLTSWDFSTSKTCALQLISSNLPFYSETDH